MSKYTALLIVFFLFISLEDAKAQESEFNPITTGVPFLLVAPDARAGGIADIGVATSPDAFSQYYNAAKYAFSESKYLLGVSYTPWLRQLANDMYIAALSFSNKIDDRSAWSGSFSYFSLGDIELTLDGENFSLERMYELKLDGSYALKLSENYSMAMTLRYILSDLSIQGAANSTAIDVVNAFSFDISGYYQSKTIDYKDFKGMWRGGYSIYNIGPKISYIENGNENFLPANLKLGGGFDFIFDEFNTLSTFLEFNKLLVPTPPTRDASGNITEGKDNNVNFVTGVFQSFSDAPRGFSEELEEFSVGIGAEYVYQEDFAFRAGYYSNSDNKGGGKYITMGTGFKFESSTIDISYLFNTSNINNPLENTLRFTLSFML